MKKKILLLMFILAICNLFIINVDATEIRCNYGDYILEFNTDNYGSDKQSDYLIIYKNGIRFDATYHSLGKPVDKSNCGTKITVLQFGSDKTWHVYTGSDHGFGNKTAVKYDLLSATSNKVSCGNVTEIPSKIPELTSMAITMIQIAVPILLVIMGSLDLFKGIAAQKEDEIKKGQQILIKRLIVAAIIFFVIVIAKLLVSVIAGSSSNNIIECIDCFLTGVNNCK